MSTELELGKLRLTIAKSHLEIFSTTTAALSQLKSPHGQSSGLASEVHTPKRAWVQRGRGLRLEVKVLVEGTPTTSAHLQSLGGILYKAKIWSQLGIKTSLIAFEEDPSKCPSNDTVSLGLSYDAYTRYQPKDTVHRLCYTIPATDVAPPTGVEVLGLDVVKLELDIRKKTRRKKQRTNKDAKPDDNSKVEVTDSPHLNMLFEPLLLMTTEERAMLQCSPIDSGYSSLFSTQTSQGDDEMLLAGSEPIDEDEDEDEDGILDFSVISTSSYAESHSVSQPCSALPPITREDSNPKKRSASLHDAHDEVEPVVVQPDCITSLVDAVLRLSIEEKPWRLKPGIRVTSNSVHSRLSDIAPALWSPGYLQEISTRVPLFPTVAHALSHSIYTSAKRPTLKTKLHTLLYCGVDDADGKAVDEEAIIERDEITPKTRFQLMSALLWQVMQKQLYQPDAARRLKGLTQGNEAMNESEEDEEELFPQMAAYSVRRNLNDFMFDDDEEDMMDYEKLEADFDDEFLFETNHYLKNDVNSDEEEDLFQGHETTVELDEDDLLLRDLDG